MKLADKGAWGVTMLKLSWKVDEKLVWTSILSWETVYFTNPKPLPVVLLPISLAK